MISYAVVEEAFWRAPVRRGSKRVANLDSLPFAERSLQPGNYWWVSSNDAWAGTLQRHGIACYECDAHAYEHWQREHYALSDRSGLDADGRPRFVVYDFEFELTCDCDRFAFQEIQQGDA